MNNIPIEAVLYQEQGYTADFVYRLLHNANRKKTRSAPKFQLTITRAIHNGIAIYKIQMILQSLLYRIPNEIETITNFGNPTSLDDSCGNGDLQSSKAKQTECVAVEGGWWCSFSSRMRESNGFSWLPCKDSSTTVTNLLQFHLNLAQRRFSITCKTWIYSQIAQKIEGSWRKIRKKFVNLGVENERELGVFLFWFPVRCNCDCEEKWFWESNRESCERVIMRE